MVDKKIIIFISIFLLTGSISAQIGGRYAFDFLNLSPSPRITSLGGVNVSTFDDDLNMGYQNPALLNDSMHHHMTLNYTNYLADINYGYVGYGKSWEGIGDFHMGVQYVGYGAMKETDAFGNILGEYTAGEWAAIVGGARELGSFRYGAQLKVLYSQLADNYTSWGLATDVGAAYLHPEGYFSAGVVIKNAGVQLTTYVDDAAQEPLPLQVIVGISNRLKYMPLRFSITAIHLEHPTLARIDPNAPTEFDLNGDPIDQSPTVTDKIFRHVVIGGEFLLGKALRLRAGYNHMRRQELRSENRGGLTGFSFGVGIHVTRLQFNYGYASYGVNSLFNAHQFGVNVNLNPLKKVSRRENVLDSKENT